VRTFADTHAHFAQVVSRLAAHGVSFRPPPAEPTSCCGRGCSGCVWESWYAAAQWWCEEAERLLTSGRTAGASR
jgi:hypothetical protein